VSSGALKVGGTTVIDSSRNGVFNGVTVQSNNFLDILDADNHVSGRLRNVSGSNNSLTIEADPANTAGGSYINFKVDTSTKLSVLATGEVEIPNSGQFRASSSNATKFVRMYAGGGTGKWDIYGNGANLRISDNMNAGIVAIDTGVSIGSNDDNPFNWGGSSNNVSITASGANDFAQLSLKGNGTGGTGINLGSGSVRHAGIFSLDGSKLAFATNASNSGTSTTTAMTILSNGNAGIGDGSPSSRLSITKNSTRTTDYENMLKITHTSSGTTGVGFGSAIYFVGERNNGVNQAMGRLVFDAEVNSGTNISSGFAVHTATVGSSSEKFRITNDGSLKAQNNSGNLAIGLLSGSGDIYLGGGAVQPSDIHLQTTGGVGVQITANKETFAKGPVYLNSGTNGTTDKLTFKTTDNGDNSKYIRMNAYWMEHSGNANEGMYFHAGEELLRLRGSTNTTPKRVDVVASNGMYVKDGLPYYHDKRGTVTTDSNGYAEVGLASWSWGTYHTFKRSALLMISFRNDTNKDQHTAFGLQTVVYFHSISQHHMISTNSGSTASIDLQANGSTGGRKLRIHNARASATLDYIIKALPIADEHWTGSGI
jgi:hypothetical protein